MKHGHADVRFLWSDESKNFSIKEGKAKSKQCRCYAGIAIGSAPHPIIEVYFDGMRHYTKLCAEGITSDLIHELCHWVGLREQEIPW